MLVPAKALISVLELKKTLLTCGHNPNVTKEYWIQAHQEVIKETDKIITLCYKPGFYGDVYLRVNDIVIGKVKGDKPVLHPSAKNHLSVGNDSNLLIVFYVQIMPDDFVMQLHRF